MSELRHPPVAAVGGRRRQAGQGMVDGHLARGIRDMVVAANDVRDLHQPVVDHHGAVVGGDAVGAQQDGIADHIRGKLHRATNQVLET